MQNLNRFKQSSEIKKLVRSENNVSVYFIEGRKKIG